MEDDFTPDFLGGEPVSETPAAEAAPAAEAPQAQAEAAPAAEAPAAEPTGPARGADGKFVAAAAETAPEAAPAAPVAQAEPAPAQPEAQHIPLAAHLDERERRQAAERQRDELQSRIDAAEQQRQREAAAKAAPVEVPDPAIDPVGFAEFQRRQVDDSLFFHRRDVSKRLAVLEHGKDVTDAAFQWGANRCDADPSFNARVRASEYPMDLVVNEWRQAQAVEKFGSIDPTEYEAFQAWKAANPGAQAQPGAAQQRQPAPAAPPGPAPAAPRASLAAAPSAGAASEPRGEDGDEVFDGMFARK